MRRLITPISAGRNRIVMIRRELPRTENANWAVRPHRTKDWRILLSVGPRPVGSAVVVISRLADSTCDVRRRPTGGGKTWHGDGGAELAGGVEEVNT